METRDPDCIFELARDFNVVPDLVMVIPDQGNGARTVHLLEGGEVFPWAEHNGKIYTGPPDDDTLLEDGTPMSDLSWEVSPYWVFEAFDEKGAEVELTPREHRAVMVQIYNLYADLFTNPCLEV